MESILSTRQSGFIEQIARRAVFSILKGLGEGGLEIVDGGESFYFGDCGSDLQARVKVNHCRMYTRLLTGGSIGIAESYVEGDWKADDLTALVRLFTRNQQTLLKLEKRMGWITWPLHRLRHLLNSNTQAGSRTNIAAHYDLGNDMYGLILDSNMQYSSAVYPHERADLEQAQQHKLKLICDQLQLGSEDHLLEIGTGWGGLACYAAKNYGCRVTTTTLSQQQYLYARQQVHRHGLQDRVELLLSDYRDLEGHYDKLVSVEMIEAVGHRFLPGYFRKLEQLLKPEGRMLIQAITIADQNYKQYRRGVDFIQRYIFPGGCLPSVGEMTRQLGRQTSMTITRLTDYGEHYARTVTEWARRFRQSSRQLAEMGYDEDFQRLWNFYFAYCEGGFREGAIGLVHFEAVKPGAKRC